VRGLFVGGTTGEGIMLALRERMSLHESAVMAAAGRVPVLLHVGANTTAEATALARHAASLQADAIVVITPTFYALPDDALQAYFRGSRRGGPGAAAAHLRHPADGH
jgi:dihydrodipicolinate synthase/N-acetylneuraminate lyase